MSVKLCLVTLVAFLLLGVGGDAFAKDINGSFSLVASKRVIDSDWREAYKALDAGLKGSLAALRTCEGGGRNMQPSGYYGWLGWAAVPNLGIPGWMQKRRSSEAHLASLAEQSVITAAVAERHGWGGWPSCSARLGLR